MDNKENQQQPGLTYTEFLNLHSLHRDRQKIFEDINETAESDEKREINGKESKQKVFSSIDPKETIQISVLAELCRVCGGTGTLSIFKEPPEKLLAIKTSNRIVSIAEMISQISGEIVRKSCS